MSRVERVALTPAAADFSSADGQPRPADVPPVRRVLRRQRADVLPGRRVPHRRRRTCTSATCAVDGVDEPIAFWMSASQFEYWRHTHLTVDVVPGRGSGFSVEAPEGVRFLIRSRLFTDEESTTLNAAAT